MPSFYHHTFLILAIVLAPGVFSGNQAHAVEAESRNDNLDSDFMDLNALHRSLASLDSHLQRSQKRSCSVGAHGHNCALSDLSDIMRSKEFLRSGHSPGKRSQLPTLDIVPSEVNSKLEEILEQRRAIAVLSKLLHAMDESTNSGNNHAKRSCRFRLGGHCLTEALDKAANQYYYLKSPESPGRRRRSAVPTSQVHAR